jgi:hypothetical protein
MAINMRATSQNQYHIQKSNLDTTDVSIEIK